MAGSSTLSENVWPGYVAAMASLLLSLLLVVAVLVITTGQVGMIQDDYVKATRQLGYSSYADVLSVAKSLGVDVDALLQEKTDVSAPSKIDPDHSLVGKGGTSADFVKEVGLPSPLQARKLLDFSRFTYDHRMAKLAAERLSRADAALLQSVDLSSVDLSKIRLSPFAGTLNLAPGVTPQMLAQIDFSQVNFGQASPQLQDRAKPFLAQRALEIMLEKKRLPAEKPSVKEVPSPPPAPVRPLPELSNQGEPALLLDFVDRVQVPDEKTLGDIRERLRLMRKNAASLLIWVQDQADPDAASVRSANLQMLRIRSLALEAGWSSEAVKVRYSKNTVKANHQEGFHIHISTPGGAAND